MGRIPPLPKEPFPLYHWSPSDRRRAINRRGLVPGSHSVDREWRPPYICLSDTPSLAYALSIDFHPEILSWDLWMVWSDRPKGKEAIYDTYADTGRAYVKEWRVYERIYKRDVWYVATRLAKTNLRRNEYD